MSLLVTLCCLCTPIVKTASGAYQCRACHSAAEMSLLYKMKPANEALEMSIRMTFCCIYTPTLETAHGASAGSLSCRNVLIHDILLYRYTPKMTNGTWEMSFLVRFCCGDTSKIKTANGTSQWRARQKCLHSWDLYIKWILPMEHLKWKLPMEHFSAGPH